MRKKPSPALGDLLLLIGEDLCDLCDTPTAGDVRLGDLVNRDGAGPMVGDLLRSLGIDVIDAIGSASRLGLDLDAKLVSFID